MSRITAILDFKGVVLHAFHAGMSPEPLYGEIKEKINTAEFGFTSFLSLYYDEVLNVVGSPMNIIACMDSGRVYRTSMFPGYKQSRSTKVQDPIEKEQTEKCQQLVKEFLVSQGVPLVGLNNQEADDVVAYLVHNLPGEKVVYTGDQDLIALGDKATIIYRGAITQDMKGVPPSCVTINKSLIGDTSDEYPGVKGFGPKAWDSIIEDFGYDGAEELDELMRRGDSKTIKAVALQSNNKAMKKAADDYDNWALQYRLAKLAPEICTGAKVKLDWYKRAPTIERLTNVLHRANCPDLIPKYARDTYHAILVTQDNLAQCVKEIGELTEETPFVAWDYETWDTLKNPNYQLASNGRGYVDMLHSDIAGCSFAVGRNCNVVYYFSVGHADTHNVPKQWVLNIIKHFEEEGVEMVAQNINFEATITKVNFGHTLKYWEDTKLYSHHVDENNENGLKFLSKHYLNYTQVSYAETLKAAGASDMSEISGEQVLSYGADDSLVTAHLYSHLTTLAQLEKTYDFTHKYECPAVEALVDAHIGGVKVDLDELNKQKIADEETVKVKMAAIRSVLLEHCAEENLDAVEKLYQDQQNYIAYKAKMSFTTKNPTAAPDDIERTVRTALDEYRFKLERGSYYEDYLPHPRPVKFSVTANGLTKVAEKLGLPPVEKITLGYLSDYATLNESGFADRLQNIIPNLKNKESTEYLDFVEWCKGVLSDEAIVDWKGTELNMGSSVQNTHLFYLLLDLPVRNRTKVQKGSMRDKGGFEGSPATDEAAIQFALANDCAEHPWKEQVLKDLLEYKEAATRLGIYWTPYPLWLDENNIMHPGFNSCGTVTRRPTGASPNLLQVSKGAVRKIFVPKRDNCVIVSVDFSSEELRVLASVCQDPTFLSAYTGEKDLDLHALTACGLAPMFLSRYPDIDPNDLVMDSPTLVNYSWFKATYEGGTPVAKFLSKCRYMAKTANFGVAYSAGPQTMSTQLMIPLADGETIVDAMSKTYPGIQTWKDRVYKDARLTGYVATTFGSRRHCGAGLVTGSRSDQSRWERQLSNFLIQGQCADLLKVAMVEILKNRTLQRYDAQLIAPIYDEILLEVPEETLQPFLTAICNDMERPMPGITVPMVADCSFGKNWGEQVEVGNRPSEAKVNDALVKIFGAERYSQIAA